MDDSGEFFDEDPFELPPFGHPFRRGRPGRELPPEVLRFGVQFSDGGKATTVEGMAPWDHGFDDVQTPSGPVLTQGGGGGGDGDWESEFWLWPLPPVGPVEFVVEWPAEKIPITRHAVDAKLFLAASANSEVLWPEADAADRGSSGSFTMRFHGLDSKPDEPGGDPN